MISRAELANLKGRLVEIVVRDHFSADEEMIVITKCRIKTYGVVHEVDLERGYLYLITEWSWFDDDKPEPRSKWAALIDAIEEVKVLD